MNDTPRPRAYAELKSELQDIAKIIELFPESLKSRVFDILIKNSEIAFTDFEKGRGPSLRMNDLKTTSATTDTREVSASAGEAESKPAKQRKKFPDTFPLDPDLDLRAKDGVKSFSDFVAEKNPGSHHEFNAVAVYYLSKMRGMSNVSFRHAWTCYKDVKRRVPEYFRQSFTDTKNKHGYLKISEDGTLEMAPRGENLVEHDLPKSEKA